MESHRPVVVIGLMSGTSADGVDAACCRLFHPDGGPLEWVLLGAATRPYDEDLAASLRHPERLTLPEVASLHVRVGVAFADAAAEAARTAGIDLEEVSLVGSHGQTVWHDPHGDGGGTPVTFQVGEPAILAARTGCRVWADFRPSDVAVGGEGAPLVPYVDWLLFSRPDRWTVCLNIGGIANVTLLPPGGGLEDVVAFDTGPGNMILDSLAGRLLEASIDVDGAAASRGRVDAERVAGCLADPYFARQAPKSTGRERFGIEFTTRHFGPLEELSDSEAEERLASAVAVTVESIARALEGEAGTSPVPAEAEVVVSGGGRRNRAVMEALTARCAPRTVVSVDDYGVDGDFKEAIAFAVLAYESALGREVNVPSTTGARRPVRCGKLVFPPGPA